MNKTAVWKGRIKSVNTWHGARVIKKGNKHIAMIYETPAYKKFKKSLAAAFWNIGEIKGYVDLQVTVVMSPRADTGNVDKPIGDALELAGVLKNDKFIRHIAYYRHYHPNSGSKNKYNDLIMIEIRSVPLEDMPTINDQQKNDVFKVKI